MYGELRDDIREIIRQLCGYKSVEIVQGSVSKDHIHICVKIPPKMSVSYFMGYLKVKSDDIRQASRIQKERGRPAFLGNGILCRYGWQKRRANPQIHQ